MPVFALGELRHRPDQDVGIPDGCQSGRARGRHPEEATALRVGDGSQPALLAQREAGPGHQVDGVARTDTIHQRGERPGHGHLPCAGAFGKGMNPPSGSVVEQRRPWSAQACSSAIL